MVGTGFFWSAFPANNGDMGYDFNFDLGAIYPNASSIKSFAFPIRPVAQQRTKVTPKTPASSMEEWQEEDLDGGSFKQH